MDSELPSSIIYEEEYIQNSRGVKFFTCRWLPEDQPIRGVVCLCHGYGVDCSIYMKGSGVHLAQAGYAVYGIDYIGHGKSDGLPCYIPDFGELVDQVAVYYKSVREKYEYRKVPKYLLGESMGGCVALSVHFKEPTAWDGAVFVVPMCKISEKTELPPALVMTAMAWLSPVIGTWPIIPANDVIDTAFKDPIKRAQVRANPYAYQGRPRVKTILEMLNASRKIESNLDKVSLPFFVLHGEDDMVTDPDASKALYNAAKSKDKTIKLYPDTWHGILVGESDEKIANVFKDIIAWLNERSPTQ
ncbi:hypothetical protein O6H91_14G055000 [Diphasiastrum complanatum]|uniref:Uncharacterized protein n=2 Tax=Diphasiastrum complanatum TaxID=34168 RepID=A0ACC2BNA4_DIPCM|nr:hypothetical protein O6H91_14G037800 [Diphasiastrum complanatum]KAJ7531703.1 hypothetical protein O6H91_14G055000 [Diphasiastrum complanatum]